MVVPVGISPAEDEATRSLNISTMPSATSMATISANLATFPEGEIVGLSFNAAKAAIPGPAA